MNKITHKLSRNIDVLLLFAFCLIVFTYLVQYIKTDITDHVEHCMKINSAEKPYPANFLFYFTVNFFSGFSNNTFFMYLITVTLLSLATVAKYMISKRIIISVDKKNGNKFFNNRIYLIALGLFFSFIIPDPYSLFFLKRLYLGKIAPIVWHNSTIILLFPFAILLFWKQLSFFDSSKKISTKDVFIINFLVVLNVFIKPSFIFVYIPVTFVFLLFDIKRDSFKTFLLKVSPVFIGGLVILIQYYLIFILQSSSIQEEPSGIIISSPFQILLPLMPAWFIPISLFMSFILPIFSLILYKEIIKYQPFLYALCLTIVGIIISAFIMESGPRMYHGNFTWQNIICSYLLLLSTILFLTPKFLDENPKSNKLRFLIGLFLLQVLSGFLYLLKIFLTSNYY